MSVPIHEYSLSTSINVKHSSIHTAFSMIGNEEVNPLFITKVILFGIVTLL